MSLSVFDRVLAWCQKNQLIEKDDAVVVAVSGGPDSLCLLHLLAALSDRYGLRLTVAHLNHQLRGPDSEADLQFVQEVARQWQLPLVTASRDVAALAQRRQQSIETAARQARYAFLWQVAHDTNSRKVAVGHHADDQAETVLMHFLRGAGLAGLRGMLPKTSLTAAHIHPDDQPLPLPAPSLLLIRPLLDLVRADIETYCRDNQLQPRYDHTNQDTTIFRNRLRHDLLPLLERYNPNLRQVLQRTAKIAAADLELLEQQVSKVWPAVVQTEQSQKVVFDRTPWLALPLALKRLVLRRAVDRLSDSSRDLTFLHIEQAIDLIEQGRVGTRVPLPHGLQVAVSYTTFQIIAPGAPLELDFPALAPDQIVRVAVPGITPISDRWQIETMLLPAGVDRPDTTAPWEAYLDAAVVGRQPILRPRRPGDRFRPFGMGGRQKKISEFMIDNKIPAEQRAAIPLLVSNGQILWLCGYRPDARAAVGAGTERILRLKFQAQSP